MSQHPLGIPDVPNPQVLIGGNALGVPPPMPPAPAVAPLDTLPDGIDPKPVIPQRDSVPTIAEFKDSTRVLFVNGINSNDAESRQEAQLYADAIGHRVELVHVATHGMLADIGIAESETINQRLAFEGAAEKAIAKEVLSLATAGKDVHIMAYSRGALVAERGLELARQELEGRGFSADYVAKNVFSHVTLETVNGASHNVPDGIRAVHYVREGDFLVGQPLGMGPGAPLFRGVLVSEMALHGDASGLAAEMRDGFRNHPNGPIIEVPPLPTANLVAQHLFPTMLPHVKPFEAARAGYERDERARQEADRAREAVHPDPRPLAAPALPHKDAAQAAVNGLRESGNHMANVAKLEPWNGHAQTGSFIDLGDGVVAQHAGRGVYRYMNVDEHLGGVQPPFGQTVSLNQTGQIQLPDQTQVQSLGRS